MITVENLSYDYPGKRALSDVSFSIAQGSITALVGPNGAGKTTLLRCLAALDIPQEGRVVIGGLDAAESPRAVHKLCGYLSDFFGLYDALTVTQCLTHAAWCHGIEGEAVRARIKEVVEATELHGMEEKLAGTLSRGYRQRLGIALALVHDPAVLILDEPASGMDPEARIGLSALMRKLGRDGRTLIVSSHILNELEDYCTSMLVIRDGRVADHVTLGEDTAAGGTIVQVSVDGNAEQYLAALASQPGVTEARVHEDTLLCRLAGDTKARAALNAALVRAEVPVTELRVAERKLQDAYMAAGRERP